MHQLVVQMANGVVERRTLFQSSKAVWRIVCLLGDRTDWCTIDHLPKSRAVPYVFFCVVVAVVSSFLPCVFA